MGDAPFAARRRPGGKPSVKMRRDMRCNRCAERPFCRNIF